MDKYEYNLKLDQMKTLMTEGDYQTAAKIADSINWRKIKNVTALVRAGEIYEQVERYEDSRDILLMAYDRSPIGRTIIYRLACVTIRMGNFDEAKEYYNEFVEIAPHDNLKYVLKYELNKAQGADYKTLIADLEALKEQEFSEEWGFELACLYHKAGMGEKCIEICDEIILYFGQGPYVERALELKMLYQPLTLAQEEKYRQFRLEKDGITEVRPGDVLSSGEIVTEAVQIPQVEMSAERFNTQNLQEALQKSMQQIMEATEKEAVDDSMDTIKKLVEEIPYLQIPAEKESREGSYDTTGHIAAGRELRDSSKPDFQELFNEEQDGQMSILVPERGAHEPQVTGQMTFEDVLAEWEQTKHTAETELLEAEQRELASAKERALKEAEDIMGRLVEMIPKLDSGLTSQDLLKESYLSGTEQEEDRTAQMVANMNQLLQREIDRLNSENAQIDEQLAVAQEIAAEAVSGERGAAAKVPQSAMEELLADADIAELLEREGVLEELLAEDIPKEDDFFIEIASEFSPVEQEEEFTQDKFVKELQEALRAEPVLEEGTAKEPGSATEPEDMPIELPEIELPEIQMPEDLGITAEIKNPLPSKEKTEGATVIVRLSKEQKELFSYFTTVKGMETQICEALSGIATRLKQGGGARTGNLIVQGGSGSGKTIFATNFIKALQQITGRPKGKVGKIAAEMLNKKDLNVLFSKIAGGCLIVEGAGELSKDTAVKLSFLLEHDTQGTLVILEDTKKGIDKILVRDKGFAEKFSERINIPIFTIDELVNFAKAYALENGYTIDEMGVLALYNCISNIQKIDKETTIAEVKEIVDDAIGHVERGAIKKAFSVLTSTRYDEDDYVILHEKDFNN